MQQKQNILIELENGFANCTVNTRTGEISCIQEIDAHEAFAGNGTLWAELCEEEQIRLAYFRKGASVFLTPSSLEMLVGMRQAELAA